jgi:hypothetical protein
VAHTVRRKRLRITLAISVLLFALGAAAVRVGSPARVVVTWETASEVETAGFHVYRGPSPSGEFSRITENPVPAEGDPLVGASYRYEDEDVAWGERYYYQLEEVELDGARNRYDETVEGRAGLGWTWALAGGVVLALLGAALTWLLPPRAQDSSAEMPSA